MAELALNLKKRSRAELEEEKVLNVIDNWRGERQRKVVLSVLSV